MKTERERKKYCECVKRKEKDSCFSFSNKKLISITRKGMTAGFSFVIFCSHSLFVVKYDHMEASAS